MEKLILQEQLLRVIVRDSRIMDDCNNMVYNTVL